MGGTKNRFLALLETRGASPVVIAHRGDSFHAPENTLEAARLAHRSGAHAWELDVQLTRDGVAVVLHDESLVRTTDVATRFTNDRRGLTGFRVADFDFDEVRSLDAGSWFANRSGGARSAREFGTFSDLEPRAVDHYLSGQVKIPTLAEALALTAELDWLVNVEIKSFPDHADGLVEKVIAIIDETATPARTLISSFDHADVAAANRAARTHGLGILTATPLYRAAAYTIDLVGADTVHVSTEVLGSDSIAYRRAPAAGALRLDLLTELNEKRVPVLVYTVNQHGRNSLAEHLMQVGVSGFFTDDPRGLVGYLGGRSAEEVGGPR
jgi:glycerophosphoryl diester phosphodiesterase